MIQLKAKKSVPAGLEVRVLPNNNPFTNSVTIYECRQIFLPITRISMKIISLSESCSSSSKEVKPCVMLTPTHTEGTRNDAHMVVQNSSQTTKALKLYDFNLYFPLFAGLASQLNGMVEIPAGVHHSGLSHTHQPLPPSVVALQHRRLS